MSDTIIMYENGKAVGGEGHPTNADEITFNNEDTDLVSEEVESAIKEVNAKFDRGSVSVTANGNKTYATLLAELYALITPSKVDENSVLVEGNSIYHAIVIDKNTNAYRFLITTFNASVFRSYSALLSATACERLTFSATYSSGTFNFNNNSSDVVPNGVTLTLKY